MCRERKKEKKRSWLEVGAEKSKANRQKLFLKQAAGDEGRDRREQPLDPPQLDGLPVENGPGAEKYADSQSSYNAEHASQKSDDGWGCKAEALTERGEFGKTRDFQGAGSVQIGPAGTASMTEERTDDKLGPATAGRAAFRA